MKYPLLILIVLFQFGNLYSQSTSTTYYYKYEDDIKIKKESGTEINGKKEGEWIFYENSKENPAIGKRIYKDGDLISSEKFNNEKNVETPSYDKLNKFNSQGKPDGLWIMWYNDAVPSIKSKGRYIDGVKDGEWIEYSYGSISHLVTYKMGIKDGLEKEYFTPQDFSCLWRETTFKNGLMNGQRITYYPLEGCPLRIKSKENYKMDIRDGQQIDYYSNGQISEIGNYKNGVKDGEWNNYDDDGQISRKTIWSNGVKTYSTDF